MVRGKYGKIRAPEYTVLERSQCIKRFYEDKKRINEQFWQKSYERQGDWLIQVVKSVNVKMARLGGEGRKRNDLVIFSIT